MFTMSHFEYIIVVRTEEKQSNEFFFFHAEPRIFVFGCNIRLIATDYNYNVRFICFFEDSRSLYVPITRRNN